MQELRPSMLPDSEQQTRAWRVMLRGEMEHAMAQHTRFMEEQTRTLLISDIIVLRGGPRVVVCGGCTGRFGLDAVPRLASPRIVHRVRACQPKLRARPRG